MKRIKYLALTLCAVLLTGLLSGCSPSPTAVTVGSQKVDASEYAFYLNYNRSNSGDNPTLYDENATAKAKEAALKQIVTNEVVRIKCADLGLTLTEVQKLTISKAKTQLIDSLGGKAAYVDYLEQSCLTDRAYDKFQENAYYYDLLYNHMAEEGKTYFTDEVLRQYFAEYYATVKYICISTQDDQGNALSDKDQEAKKTTADKVLELARQEGADFDALMAEYNEDPTMTAGFVISQAEAASTDNLETLFSLKEGQVSDIITGSDGYYILQRSGVSATYYDENQEDIYQSALDWRFAQTLEQWKASYTVDVSKVVDKMNLNNLEKYVK